MEPKFDLIIISCRGMWDPFSIVDLYRLSSPPLRSLNSLKIQGLMDDSQRSNRLHALKRRLGLPPFSALLTNRNIQKTTE